MSGPVLTVGKGVIAELVKTAAFEVPGVARVGHGGPSWRAIIAGPAVRVRVVDDRVLVRLRIVARPGRALGPLTAQVRTAVAATSNARAALSLASPTPTCTPTPRLMPAIASPSCYGWRK